MQIVIIGGLPCSGKSKFAERLQSAWNRPLLSKDEFKETLFDTLGSSDREWSRKLSDAAYALLFKQAEACIASGVSCIVEGNFRERQHRGAFLRLATLCAAADVGMVQVHCHAKAEVLVSRFTARSKSGQRHAGHADLESLVEIENELRSTQQRALAIPGDLIECDTTDDWNAAIETALVRTLELLDR